jgi:hypothetical protein
MTRPPLLVYDLPPPSRYTLLKGPIFDWLRDQPVTATWTPRLNGWCVRTEKLGDLIAWAEHDGFAVRVKGTAR